MSIFTSINFQSNIKTVYFESVYSMPDISIIGSGNMAQTYVKVLRAKKYDFNVIGRGQESADNFTDKTGISVLTGGLEDIIASSPKEIAPCAIVALPVAGLATACKRLINLGTKRILVEKPAGLNLQELEGLTALARQTGTEIRVALNRRFLASVQEIKKRVVEDGGVSSFNFEFTEWSEVIEKTKHPVIVKENWFLANSLHVVDLAFYLGGEPSDIFAISEGELDWHSRASRFAGAGRVHNGALFSYQADWGAPGRWRVEVLTKSHRYILAPLEGLLVQELNKVKIDSVDIDDSLDKEFKPGLYRMIESFLEGRDDQSLPNIETHFLRAKEVYTLMLPEDGEKCKQPRMAHIKAHLP